MGLESIIGGITGTLSVMVNLVSEYAKQVYSTVTQAISYMISYVDILFNSFPPDNAKRTLWLAIIFFLIVVAITIIFNANSWFSGGLGPTKPYTINADNQQANLRINNSESQYLSNETSPSTTLGGALPFGKCNSDNDCKLEGGFFNTLCCYPSSYANYSCAGACQKFEGLSRDACKHPNSCLYFPQDQSGWLLHAKHTGGRCDVTLEGSIRGNPDQYCRDQTGSQLSVCCNSGGSVCYGYCLTNPQLDCDSEYACDYENLISVVTTFGGDQK